MVDSAALVGRHPFVTFLVDWNGIRLLPSIREYTVPHRRVTYLSDRDHWLLCAFSYYAGTDIVHAAGLHRSYRQ